MNMHFLSVTGTLMLVMQNKMVANNKGADQTAWMCKLICVLVFHKRINLDF